VYWPDGSNSDNRINTTEELNFPRILNHNLPTGVRVLGWAPVSPDFNARLNCKQRVYNYIFPKGNLELEKMREACQFLVGTHDFRNFCQIDNSKCRLDTSYTRQIFSAEINELENGDGMCQLTVKGSGFLWHQIRFIVGLLFEIGSKNEESTVWDIF
jgi:tRNA pseudouridine38/39 synthase